MKNYKNIDEILDFAIKQEQSAYDFYTKLANQAQSKEIRKTFEDFAAEEQKHKQRLENVKATGQYIANETDILNMKISDYLVSPEVSENISYQDALILAMKREKAAFKLYMKLYEISNNDEMKTLFRNLANEEAKHKLNFELEYDDVVYKEN